MGHTWHVQARGMGVGAARCLSWAKVWMLYMFIYIQGDPRQHLALASLTRAFDGCLRCDRGGRGGARTLHAGRRTPVHMLSMGCAGKAAQYSDEWVTLTCGSKKGHFRAFYLCMSGGADKCGTVILNKVWLRRREDPLKAKQRWYCGCCGARYKATFGMLTETYYGGEHFFAQEEIPNQDVEDVRATDLEERLQTTSPEALTDVHPFTGVLIRQVRRDELMTPDMDGYGIYKVADLKALAELATFQWGIFNFKKK